MADKSKGTWQHLTHDAFGPLFDGKSEILILGSFPSVKSREEAFYYGHPQNRFWPLMARILTPEDPRVPATKEERTKIMVEKHIALWDVVESCDIIGSSDASIKNVEVTDLRRIIHAAPVRKIFINGKTAYRLYRKYSLPLVGEKPEAVCLPSTSPANAAWSMDRLLEEWKAVGEELEKGRRSR
jgi:hypoxanthine-DNA glycosylase